MDSYTRAMPRSYRGIILLAVVNSNPGAELERILSHTGWHVHLVHSTADAIQVTQFLPISVILCEQELPDGTWRDIIRGTERLSPRPQTIVVAANADSRLWAEVLNCGGYDVLALPLEPKEVYDLVPMAWRRWKMAGPKTVTYTNEANHRLVCGRAR